ncbi:tetratricopeptide repeat protein [Streptomyces sp. A0642]|uniref:ATP-binding protein n=1 Tax=Streptomyces sp. A0642 TaxID=2563100 RepID=UPI0010A26CD7|nr:BTAD domain-containing putative transcriptional regulator [Streptomyces sp. A0642]THA69351.1 tetratricopeptide repeat protein [Streptomyces sp. A0642]
MTTDLTLLPRVAYRGQELTAPRLRGLLALLAGDLRTGCSTGRLVEGLWPDELPERPGKAVQVLVSRARSLLGAEVIVSTPTGYRLALAEDQVDASALLLHAAAGADRARAGDHAGSLAAAEAGLALWAGTPDTAGAEGDPVAALRAERAPVREALVRARALALARLGRHAEAAGPLAAAASAHPRDEEVLAELLRGEAATTGPSAALTRYEAYRGELRDELGTDPGAALKAVQHELLRGETPPVRHGVPHEPNPLLGRDEDIAAVRNLLRTSRVVTVAGPGGLGKTRLSHAVCRRAEQRVVHFVPLAGVTADADVAAEVASALGAGAMSGQAAADPVAGILGVLGSGPALLVLDNCEQVIGGAADLVQALVSSSKNLRVLATSRAPLGLTSEAVYALPELGTGTAVELFVQRARAARPGVELLPDAVADLCRHLEGLPLAVELAAARVRVLSVPEIARRLGDRFALLRGGARDAPERHRTLHAVVDWSWNLLAEDARAALRTLSVFPGGFCGEAAEHVLGDDALFLLEQLTDQSLLTAADTPAGVRFRMLETVREFSAARRAEAGEDEAAIGLLLSWARGFGVTHHDWFFSRRPRAAWERIRPEQDNLVLALRLALAREDARTVAALTAVLAALWSTDSGFPRLATLASDTGPILSHYHPEPAYVEVARAAAAMCTAGLFMANGPVAVRQLVTLRRLPAAPPDTLPRAIATVLGAVPEMLPPGHETLRGLCDSQEPLVAGVAESIATYVWEYEHDIDRALASARRILTELAPVESPSMQLMGHSRLSELCLRTGRGEEAYEHLRATLEVVPRLGDGHDYLFIRRSLVLACLQRGDPEEAEYWLRQAEHDNTPQQDSFYRPDLAGRAEIALARGLSEVGLGLWRDAVERVSEAGAVQGDDLWLDPSALHIQSAAVTAHAHAGRLGLVAEPLGRLRKGLETLLSGPVGAPWQLPVFGTVLHALGLAGLASDGGDVTAVRMLALAERLRVMRDFQPTMSADRARRAAENADRAAYADAMSEYAALERDELWDTARALTSGLG